jgi:hypothetical protein
VTCILSFASSSSTLHTPSLCFFSSSRSSLSWFACCSIVNYWSCNLWLQSQGLVEKIYFSSSIPSLILKCLCEQCCTNVYVKVIMKFDVYHSLLHKNLQPTSTLEVIEFYLMFFKMENFNCVESLCTKLNCINPNETLRDSLIDS